MMLFLGGGTGAGLVAASEEHKLLRGDADFGAAPVVDTALSDPKGTRGQQQLPPSRRL